MQRQNYYAKILLFGEYGVILDSMALSVPFTHFHGELSFGGKHSKYKYTDYEYAIASNAMLAEYVHHLENLCETEKLDAHLDIQRLKGDLERGLYFESTIPQGYGLGSSGALVASVYDGYATNKITPKKEMSITDLLHLKRIFSTMEGFFHGRSSGIDPLNAFIQYPLLFKSSKTIETVEIPQKRFKPDTAIFLINSQEPGKTEPMVNLFLKNTSKIAFNELIVTGYIPLINLSIKMLIQADMDNFFIHLKELSEFQFLHFDEMIPELVYPVWENGLKTDDYYIKLCGSGGGGYFLGFSNCFSKVKQYFNKQGVDFITVYKGC